MQSPPTADKTAGPDASGGRSTIRRRLYLQLEPQAWTGGGLSPLNMALVCVIVFASLVMIVETEPTVTAIYGVWIDYFEWFFGLVFLAEYLGRLWVAPEASEGEGGWRDRLKFAVSPWGLLDFFIVVATIAPLIGPNVTSLRLVRIVRIVVVGKLGRMTEALSDFGMAIRSRRYELTITLGLCLSVMLVGATVMWLAERQIQPEQFGSIPRALWWAVVTLTTIGYGDVYPITVVGRLFAAVFSLAGIGLIALPSGILASAFSDMAQRRREMGREE